jgi:Zn-dependent protease with chaperone function
VPPRAQVPNQITSRNAADNFIMVVRRVEPVAEQMCRERTPRANCDFLVVVDDRPGQPPNAFQTLDRNGRPVIGFTLALLADARNQDELAFVFGHEAAHHIAGHIPIAQRSATEGALVGGLLATLGGLDAQSAMRSRNWARRWGRGAIPRRSSSRPTRSAP